MPRGHSPSIYGRFSGKQRTSLYISREKGNHYYIQTRHNDLFFPLQSFSWKLTEKLARKVRVNTQRVYWIVLMPLGHPIILLKSNKFNMAAVSVKGSIVSEILDSLSWIIRRIPKSCIPDSTRKGISDSWITLNGAINWKLSSQNWVDWGNEIIDKYDLNIMSLDVKTILAQVCFQRPMKIKLSSRDHGCILFSFKI